MVRLPTFTYLYSMPGVRLPLYTCPVSPDTVVISRAAYTPIAVADSGVLSLFAKTSTSLYYLMTTTHITDV